MYDYCVGETAKDGAINGYKTYMIEDATPIIAEDSAKIMKDKLDSVGVEHIQSD